MSRKLLLAGALVLLCAMPGRSGTATGKATLDRLKTLAGDWSLVEPGGEPTGLRATYRAVAGGAAVMETLFAGTPEETVAIYHLEGSLVTVTRLTARGAPVRLEPRESKDPEALRFDADPEAAPAGEISGLGLVWTDEEHVRIEWTLPGGAEAFRTRTFTLRRDIPVEDLAAEVARLRVGLETLQRELDRHLKRRVSVQEKGEEPRRVLETLTMPGGPGWSVSGDPFRLLPYEKILLASTYGRKGDAGMTVAHLGFRAGPSCRVRFSVIGGHGYVAVLEETKAPPRRIGDLVEFDRDLGAGKYGKIVERVVGGQWTLPVHFDWDLSKYEGRALRLYVVDAYTDHYGQISVSEVTIREDAPD